MAETKRYESRQISNFMASSQFVAEGGWKMQDTC